MLCPKCNRPLVITNSRLEFVNDDTPKKQTEAYRCLDMVCTTYNMDSMGTPCPNYAGNDLQEPLTIVETVRHREV